MLFLDQYQRQRSGVIDLDLQLKGVELALVQHQRRGQQLSIERTFVAHPVAFALRFIRLGTQGLPGNA